MKNVSVKELNFIEMEIIQGGFSGLQWFGLGSTFSGLNKHFTLSSTTGNGLGSSSFT